MKLAKLLYNNAKWLVTGEDYSYLITHPTTMKQLTDQLLTVAVKQYPDFNKVNVNLTEFNLNKIALSRQHKQSVIFAKNNVDGYIKRYNEIAEKLENLQLPSSGNSTRVEDIATLVTMCTQTCVDDNTLKYIIDYVMQHFKLSASEQDVLEDVIQLYFINYFTASIQNESKLTNQFDCYDVICDDYCEVSKYMQTCYVTNNSRHVINNFGNSVVEVQNTKLHENTITLLNNKRNVFDTFTMCKFGNHTANFSSVTSTLEVAMQFVPTDCCEIRRYSVTNKTGFDKKLQIVKSVENANETFNVDNALCSSHNSLYRATVITQSNNCLPLTYNGCNVITDIEVQPNATTKFEIITLVADNVPELCEKIAHCQRFGATHCPYVTDTPSNHVSYGTEIQLTPTNNLICADVEQIQNKVSYCYRFGNNDVATFADGTGHTVTLINGFPFTQESWYAVNYGKVTKLDSGNFTVNEYGYKYDNLSVTHDFGKTWKATFKVPTRVIAYFQLAENCTVTHKNNTFTVSNAQRCYTFCYEGELDSYTDNALECNPNKIRYKLSDTLGTGNILALSFHPSNQVSVTVTSAKVTEEDTPLIKECLLSTYLNYYNNKALFCLNNMLVKPNALLLASLCYTNATYVKNYCKTHTNNFCYYNETKQLVHFTDSLTVPLAVVYYSLLTNDLSLLTDDVVTAITDASNNNYADKDICVKALLLKKMVQLPQFDKVAVLTEYNKVKKTISNDVTLNGYAQAIGAIAMHNPSKERLKDLCQRHNVEKCWYYVSQIENLYGVDIHCGKLIVRPQVSTNVLEQLCINVDGKRIATSFAKGATSCMYVNGISCFQPFCPKQLKEQNNTLLVKY